MNYLRVWCWVGVTFGLMLSGGTARAVDASYLAFDPAMQAGTLYTIDAGALHPTQFSLGFREVRFKRDAFDQASATDLTKTLKKKNVPVVIGPGGVPYMTDGHHTIRALLDSRQLAKVVYGTILENWSALPVEEFWRRMAASNYVYLIDAAGRGPQKPAELPATLREMQSDHYRGLAWAVMKQGGFAEKNGVYFQEFRWADYFRSRLSWDDASEAEFARALADALLLARRPEAAGLPGYLGGKN